MRITLSLILICLTYFYSPTLAAPPGMVRVYVHTDNDTVADIYGSGAIISPTLILTNWHVVEKRRQDSAENDRSVQVRFIDGTRSNAAVLQQDKTWDIALLKIHPTKFKPFPLGVRPVPGQIATYHGFGGDYEYVARTGKISPVFQYPRAFPNDPDFIIVLGVLARGGDSGGPITDKGGAVIGLLRATSTTYDKYVLGTSIDRIEKTFDVYLKDVIKVQKDDDTNYLLRGFNAESKQELRDRRMEPFRPSQTAYK